MGANNTFTLVCVYTYRGIEAAKQGEFATVEVECRDPAEIGFKVIGHPGSYEILCAGMGQHLGKWVDRDGGVWDRWEATTVRGDA